MVQKVQISNKSINSRGIANIMKSMAAAILVVSIIFMLTTGCSDNGRHYSKETLDGYAQQLTSDLKELTPTQSWSLSTDEKRGKLMLGIAELSDTHRKYLQEKYGEMLEIKPGPIPVPATT
jgi:hypothetical protein